MFDWDAFLVRLGAYPPDWHRLLPPCPSERVREAEKQCGKLPVTLKEMFTRFNGAQLFCSPNPCVSIFRISTSPPPPPFEWAPEWCIDAFTPKWRASGSDRERDWAIAMTNYGGLILLDQDGTIKEWDTAVSTWLVNKVPFSKWIEKQIKEGEIVMAEC
jgi:hypothetical protein